MSQIDREMQQTERGPGTLFASFATLATLSSPLHGALARSYHEPWTARAWRWSFTALHHAVDTMLTWRERANMRRRLLTLDDRLLKDIGITRAQAYGEAEKPFWRV